MSDRIIIKEDDLSNKVTGTLQNMVVSMLTSATKKYVPITFKSWPLKAKKQHIAKVQKQLPLYDILQKYENTGRVMPNDMKTLGDGLIIGVDWFMAGVKRDSERKQIASKNLSNSKVSLPKRVGNINLQSYEPGEKSIDPKDFQPFGFRTRL
jgi:hypothetical protein